MVNFCFAKLEPNDAKSMTINPLSIFYRSLDRWQVQPSGSIYISWKCDPAAVLVVSRAGNLDLAGVARSNLDLVNTYFDRRLIVDELGEPQSSQVLITTIVDNLYRWRSLSNGESALTQSPLNSDNCWFNWIGVMTVKSACHIWRKIPSSQQSAELFERLITPTLSVQDLLAGFDPQYQPNLFVGLQGWTYQVVKYHAYTSLRANGHPYFGLSNLGIVARSSYKQMRVALAANIVPAQLEVDISICKVFKNYLERSKVSTNKLKLADWQEILAVVQAISIDLTIEELGSLIDRVGSLIRAAASPVVYSYDDQSRSISIDHHASLPAPDIDESAQILGQLFTIIDRFIGDLSAESQKIVMLYHHQHLKQKEVAMLIAQDRLAVAKSKHGETPRSWSELSPNEITKLTNNYQTKVSRKLGDIYLDLLDNIYIQISHPEGKVATCNSLAIEAVKQLLEQYFRQINSIKIT
jgi:hypothetical protein